MWCNNEGVGSTISGDDSYSRRRGTGDDFKSLVSNFIQTITDDSENARAALISTEGLERVRGRRRTAIGPTVVIVLTNGRLMFIAPDEQMELEEWSVYYGDIKDTAIHRDESNRLEVETVDDERWEGTLPNANPDVLDAMTRHLRWVGSIRRRVLTLESHMDEVADDIRDEARAMNWEAAREHYREARDIIDTVIVDVQLTSPTADEVLAPELTDIERTLEEANVRLYIERARSQLELGKYLVEHENYDRAGEVLGRAVRLHRYAMGQSDEIKRGDAFEFGRQRELNDDLTRLDWELESVAAEPIRQAKEAVVRAEETDDATTAVEYWETAFDRYSRMLELEWWQEIQDVTDELDDVAVERQQTVDHLISMREDLGHEQWDEAVTEQRDGNVSEALECCRTAVKHFERAHELADEFDRAEVDDLAEHLETVTQLTADIQENRSKLHSDRRSPRTRGASNAEPVAGSTDAPESDQSKPDQAETEDTASDPAETEDSASERADEPEVPETLDLADPTESDDEDADDNAKPTPISELTTVRLVGERFTDVDRESGEWIPPSKSDIAAIETPHELTFDLDEIGLPSDVGNGDDDRTDNDIN